MVGQGFWAALVPELMVADIDRSRRFYCGLCGFAVGYERPEDSFIYLQMGGAQIMLEEVVSEAGWITAPLQPPFGRGVNFQIEVTDVSAIASQLDAAGVVPFRALHEKWYRAESIERGQMQLLVQDPDGYLLRFIQDLGTRPAV